MNKKVTDNKEFMLRCGKRVKECREAAGYTQSELSATLETLPENNGKIRNEKHISAVERGERRLSIEYARLISKVLNVREEYLLCQDNFKTKQQKQKSFFGGLTNINQLLLSLLKINGISVIDLLAETEEGHILRSTGDPKIIAPEKCLVGQVLNISGEIQTPKSLKACIEVNGIRKDIPIDMIYYLQKDIMDYAEFKCEQFKKDFKIFENSPKTPDTT